MFGTTAQKTTTLLGPGQYRHAAHAVRHAAPQNSSALPLRLDWTAQLHRPPGLAQLPAAPPSVPVGHCRLGALSLAEAQQAKESEVLFCWRVSKKICKKILPEGQKQERHRPI